MNITILCTSASHPVNAHIERWIQGRRAAHQIHLLRSRRDLTGGDLLLLVSCGEIIGPEDRAKFRHTLVLHASDLPKGRGWNPHVWQIIGGATRLTVTLLEAEDKVDTGAIWHQVAVEIDRGALWNEINDALFAAEMRLLDYAVDHLHEIVPRPQCTDVESTYFRLRTPADSRIDPERTIAEQFDLLRVCDPQRYPAFFELRGQRYRITLEKVSDGT
jgi:methionyl-tRNA formyltransferase